MRPSRGECRSQHSRPVCGRGRDTRHPRGATSRPSGTARAGPGRRRAAIPHRRTPCGPSRRAVRWRLPPGIPPHTTTMRSHTMRSQTDEVTGPDRGAPPKIGGVRARMPAAGSPLRPAAVWERLSRHLVRLRCADMARSHGRDSRDGVASRIRSALDPGHVGEHVTDADPVRCGRAELGTSGQPVIDVERAALARFRDCNRWQRPASSNTPSPSSPSSCRRGEGVAHRDVCEPAAGPRNVQPAADVGAVRDGLSGTSSARM